MPDRSHRHSLVFIMSQQIDALRRSAALIYEEAGLSREGTDNDIGRILAINMFLAFALELSLKRICMSFHEEGPARGHCLLTLWEDLPAVWRDDLAKNFSNDPRSHAEVVHLFFTKSPQPPEALTMAAPDFSSADQFFAEISDQFIRSRYSYEELNPDQLATIKFAYDPCDAMLDLLAAFYGHLCKPTS